MATLPFSPAPTSLATLCEYCYASAYRALAEGDHCNATRLFAILALLAPRDERAWLGLALTREQRGDYRAAAGLYQAGSVLAPRSARCLLGRGRALKRLGRYLEAEQALQAAETRTDDARLLAAIEAERSVP